MQGEKQLLEKNRQQEAQLALLSSVQEGLLSKKDIAAIYVELGEKIKDLFDTQVAAICTFDHNTGQEIFQYVYEEGERHYPIPRPIDKLRKKLIEEAEIIYISEDADAEWTRITGEEPSVIPGTKPTKSALYVPMVAGKTVSGYISIQNVDREHAFKDEDIRLLNTIAASIGITLENARLFNETEERNAELAVINSVQQGLVAETDMQDIYDLVGDKIRNLFEAQVAAIATFDIKNKLETFNYLYEDGKRFYPPSQKYNKLRQWIIDHRRPLHINEDIDRRIEEITGEEHVPVEGTRRARSLVFVPLTVGEQVTGYVSLQNLDKEHAFKESDVQLLTTLANSMSVALENARLFNETTRLLNETEKKNKELQIINSVQESLVREIEMKAIYKEVGKKICEILGTQTLIIRTFDQQSELEYWEYAVENGMEMTSDPRPIIWANKLLLQKREPLLINENYLETAAGYGSKGFTEGKVPLSAIFIPMIVGDVVKGSVSLQNIEKEHAFSEDDVRLLTTLTNSMSFAIENARLFNETSRLLNETERRAAELHTVNSISKAIVSQLELDALIQLVGEQMRKTFNADIVYLALHNRSNNMLHFPYYYGDVSESRIFGNGITEKIILSKAPLLVNADIERTYEKIKAEKRGKMVASYLGVPIMVGDEAIGVISVQSREQINRFSENDQHLLTTIAANIGIAIQNAETYRRMKAALDELKAAQNQLVQQEKLASLGQLTAGIAHEIKNPLNFVNNFSDVSIELIEEASEELNLLISENESLNANSKNAAILNSLKELFGDLKKNLNKIHEHGSRADTIVKSMLQHSRGGTGKMQQTDLNLLVKEYVNLAFHGMRAGKNPINVDIILELDKELGLVPVIREDFSRVILNLCNNAFDAIRDKLSSTSFTPALFVRTCRNENVVQLTVEDNGPGIPDDIKDKILQPFFTTKKGTEGTGLGLSITNDIMKAHGGKMDIETSHGIGTKFILHLSADKLMVKDPKIPS